ncbi:TonB-dependent receptor plug domain-containing protein [Urechidicola vernalis]|uniref:TonB-dependent receptor n=1 Tax=Urechidicola vernalis TaxID=3075600 RepID=A0ABU2Y4Q5_9FLAO|nr:TonB-dependent receptor [Urechidicola sp. P050]MDT0552043.1 TonB-dependent receptor [Urechidicola sp. P050]
MKKNTFYLAVCVVLMAQNLALAQEQQEKEVEQLDEIFLSDTKFELKKENSGKIIYKISQKDIQQNSGKTIIDLLDNIPGIEINGNNNVAGSNIGIYIRGGRNRQVAIAIDGVLLNNPTGIAASFNLNLIDVNQIESIEILKGSSSTLYGSGAATGVINIKLKKAVKSPFNIDYLASIGTNNSQRTSSNSLENLEQNLSMNGSLDKFNYLLSFSLKKEDGISAANDKNSPIPFETDAFLSENALMKLGYKVSDDLSIGFFGNFNSYDYDYDGGAYFDSSINNGTESNIQFGLTSDYKYKKGNLKLTVSSSDLDREFDSYNGFSGTIDHYEYKGTSLFAEAINKFELSESSSFILGVNFQEFDNQTNTPFGDIDKDVANYSTFDPFVSYLYTNANGFNLNVGARLNNHSEYGSHLVYHINPSYNLISNAKTNLKVLGSYSTAFIAPSTYQLFSFYGNLDLEPEENATAEIGLEFSNNKWLDTNVVFFNRDEENAIILPDFITYQNADYTINAKGIETSVNLEPTTFLNLNLSHTFTEKSADVDYIPKHKFVVGVGVVPFKKAFININYKNVGERTYFDQWGSFGTPGEDVILDAYSLVDVGMNYTFNHLTLFALASNLFNVDYEDVLGYSTKGRNFKLGLRLNF